MPESGPLDVLVVGAGPVGMTVAYELARRGVRVRLIDRAGGPAVTSRATATHARTLEIFDQMGLLRDLLPRGQRVVHFSLHRRGRTLIRFDTNYTSLPTRYPFSLMVDQIITEATLRNGLRSLGVEVEWGIELESFQPGAETVEVRLRQVGGEVTHLAVPWLVGADGAHSTVRKGLGLRLHGESTETWMNADVVLDADLPRDSNHLLHIGRGTILLVPFPNPGKWRAVDTVDVHDAGDWEVVRKRLARKISEALGRPVEVSAPSWVSVFTAQQRMVRQMRVGRCFVAGDAAHVHSPASGQGMNTGIQDAYNLGWKLANVVSGQAETLLLDSYAAERVPIGETLLHSTKTATALVALRTALAPVLLPAGLAVLSALKPVKQRIEAKMIRGFSGLALNYADSPLSRSRAPGPPMGFRVGCTDEMAREHRGWRELCVELADVRWTLLAFADDSDALQGPLDEVDRAYGDVVSVRTVSRGTWTYSGRCPLRDPDGALAAGLGARAGDLALIRPDGYEASRTEFTGTVDLLAWLAEYGLIARAQRVHQRGLSLEGKQAER